MNTDGQLDKPTRHAVAMDDDAGHDRSPGIVIRKEAEQPSSESQPPENTDHKLQLPDGTQSRPTSADIVRQAHRGGRMIQIADMTRETANPTTTSGPVSTPSTL
jgi:hypothetical protein